MPRTTMDLPSKLSAYTLNTTRGSLTFLSYSELSYHVPETNIILKYHPEDGKPYLNISSIAACAYHAADVIIEAINNRRLNYLDHPPSDAPQRTCHNENYGAYLHVGYGAHNQDALNWMQLVQIFQGLAAAVQPPWFYNFDCTIFIYNGNRALSFGYQSWTPKDESPNQDDHSTITTL